jgi:Stress responsive A/B Barrel Domain
VRRQSEAATAHSIGRYVHDDRIFNKFVCEILSGSHNRRMFSHVVIFWTDPNNPKAADELIAGANKYLKPIPGVLHYHIGKMAPSDRPVVDQTYQVAMHLVFPDKKTQDDYQVHPMHIEFVKGVFKTTCIKVVVYDFE